MKIFNHVYSLSSSTNVLWRMIFICTIIITFMTVFVAADEGQCSESSQFQCPNADACPDSGYSIVKDCLDCVHNLNTDFNAKQCFHRVLLNAKDNPSPSYLYRDIVGIIVWFIAAGVATACGVGGGGIYVPLGILLLAFAPKPSSGLSQASIFGASLGGLILNVCNKHPYTTKIEDDALPPERQEQIHINGTSGDINDVEGCDHHPEATTSSQRYNQTGTETISSIPTQDETPHDTETVHYYTRPLIDYDMAMFLAPMEMAGAVLGVLIQKILPNWLYLMISAVILGYTSKKTYDKWWDTHKKEKAAREAQIENQLSAAQPPTTESKTISKDSQEKKSSIAVTEPPTIEFNEENGTNQKEPSDIFASGNVGSGAATHNTDDSHSYDGPHEIIEDVLDLSVMDAEKIARRDAILQRDSRQYPAEKIFVFIVLWIGLTLLTFFKGGKGVDSIVGITCQDAWYGVLIGFQFLWTLGFAAYFGRKLINETEEKKAIEYPFHPDDVVWDFKKTRFYAFFTFVAGIVAGLIGIGGGMVLGPLMLIMGINPRVSTATTATMIVLTSSSVAILFVTSGLIPWQYAVCFFCTCLAGAYVGKLYIDGYVKKTGKTSLLIFLLATIIAFATTGTLVIVLLRLADANWCFAGFNQFCKPPAEDQDIICAPIDASGRFILEVTSFYNDVMGDTM